jgi:arabinose-5-phosphate isomerase
LEKFADILENARQTFEIEAQSILDMIPALDENFVQCVELIKSARGKVVITGIGKSAIIAQKIAATFNSTGTPAVFMHAADAIHGDLGTITNEDLVICISKSGTTPEIKVIVPLLKSGGNTLIAIVGNTESFLAQHADFILNTSVEKEACPNNLAPTSSTTAQLAMGDALAVCVLYEKGFTKEDFAKYHPGGTLGKKLYLRVNEVSKNNEIPMVDLNDSLKKVIIEISSKRLGATAVMNNGELAGIITDGDIRRSLEKSDSINNIKASEIMNANPKKIEGDELATDALLQMQQSNIMQLLVVQNGKFSGFIHMHDLLKEGII